VGALSGLADMLSIGKLATGQANYYLQQVDSRIDRATSVASGVEDYYLGGSEPAGEWIGSGLMALGLSGRVDDKPLHRTLAGQHPASGDALRSSGRARVPGFDLTFSAPKSVSVLFGICPDSVRAAIENAHDVAVRDALEHVERASAHGRRGHDGLEVVQGDGLVAAAFRHRTSRAGDPQLHTHVLVANLVRGSDGRWGALDGRRLYAHAKTAGYLYEARLRAELTRTLGVGWTPIRNGIADVAGVPRPVLRAFSRRRQEIEAELARHGASSAAAAQAAALSTRRSKDRLVDPQRLMPEWRERAASLGFDDDEMDCVFGRQTTPELSVDSVREVADELAGPGGLTHRVSSFSRRDVVRAWCERLPAGADVSSARAERLADRFLASPRAVALVGTSRPPADVVRIRRGGAAPLLRDDLRYSTPELLAIEQRIVTSALEGVGLPVGIASRAATEAALARRPFLSSEQQTMVRRLTCAGGQIVAVVGKAGTGKTTALTGAREAWEASGVAVVGAAVARRAARELQEAAGIPSTSLAALLLDLRRGEHYGLAPGTVVVLDEASMLASRELAELVDYVRAAGGKLVLCGDHRQLPSIRAGGAFRAVAMRTNAIELTENRRQHEPWERQALDELRSGSSAEAIRAYEARERLVLGADKAALMKRLVTDWWSLRDAGETLMIALRRADVGELNEQARSLMRAAGVLGADVDFGCGSFACGDHVVLRRNQRRLGVANGELGIIGEIGSSSITVVVRGRNVELPNWYLATPPHRPSMQHAYAVTGHVAQGMTVDHTLVLGSPEIYREWGYTAMSRGRRANRLYVPAPDDLERREMAPRSAGLETADESLARTLATSAAKLAAIDTALVKRLRAATTRDLQRRARSLRALKSNAVLASAARELQKQTSLIEKIRSDSGAAERRLSELARRRPSVLHARARAAHVSRERRLRGFIERRRDELAAASDAMQQAASTVERLRTGVPAADGHRRVELALIDEELARRVATQHVADRVNERPT
jgi:conjugative relaxase-like TrwC/TraI family protein